MKTLVIMAAGMGSRFGGLKQIEPVGPSKEIIADYSVYDAKKAGFEKVIFIIRKEHEEYFKTNIINKYKNIKIELAFQELDCIPSDVTLPKDRVKMLGTGHALYCARDLIDDDFVLINADDFYGYNSYEVALNFFAENQEDYLSVNYPYCVTKSEHGKVKRGVVKEEKGFIQDIIECEITEKENMVIARSLITNEEFPINQDTLVSVNFFGLRKNFLPLLEQEFDKFIHGNIDLNSEFLLPEVLKMGIKNKTFRICSKASKSKWIGMTYKEDLALVKESINKLIEEGEYPDDLWN